MSARRPRRPREVDVINVNLAWTVVVGTRMHGYSIGVVRGADRRQAMVEARKAHPDKARLFVMESFR